MKTDDGRHTTDYRNTLITVSADTRAVAGTAPPRGRGTVAERQFTLLAGHDHELTSDDVLFTVHADRAGIPQAERPAAREAFFSRGQPCLRTSPLAKTYGWGLFFDADAKVALVGVDSPRYAQLLADENIAKHAAMRSAR